MAAMAFHRLSGHSYPHRIRPSLMDTSQGDRSQLDAADIEAVLSDIGESFDIAPEDLVAIVRAVERRAASDSPRTPSIRFAQARADACGTLRLLNLLCVTAFMPHGTMDRATFSMSCARTRNNVRPLEGLDTGYNSHRRDLRSQGYQSRCQATYFACAFQILQLIWHFCPCNQSQESSRIWAKCT
jgi:hypothetical protein